MLRTVGLAEQAYQQLKKQIRSGAFSEHEAVYENQVAERLGVSRTPIREAVRMLENEGLVERLTRGGIRAVPITSRDLAVAIEARQALETIIVRWAITAITDEQLEELGNVLQRAEASLTAERFGEVLQANESFHRLLAGCTGSRLTSQLVGRIYDYLRPRELLQRIKDPGVLRDLLKAVQVEHAEIADALRSRDLSRSIDAMANHQNEVGKRYQELFGVAEPNSCTGGSNE